jgi:Protein of unknown function (DUF3152)
VHRRVVAVLGTAVGALVLSACVGSPDAVAPESSAGGPSTAGPERRAAQGEALPATPLDPEQPTAEPLTTEPPSAEPPSAEPPTAEPAPAEPPSADRLAGVLSRDVAPVGSGGTVVVPGAVPAPGAGRERRVRVEVESGLALDGGAVADFVLATLNDPRSWAAEGLAFARTDGDADVVVVLASPETSARMCRPLVTFGRLSCRQGNRAVITTYRWVNGMEDYRNDLTGYRRYVANHEGGHGLGHGHVPCPAAGRPAPVMQQQTKDVDPCVPNPWPYP